MMRTRDENWARLERQRDEARATLSALDSIFIADQVLRSGFHPHRKVGRVITEILLARHRGQYNAPLTPEISHSDVVAVASHLGVEPDLEPLEVAHV